MIIESFVDFLLSKSLENGYAFIRENRNENKLKQNIIDYANNYFKNIFNKLPISQEFDFHTLNDFIQKELFKSIALSFNSPKLYERKRLKDYVYNSAYIYAGADTNEKKQVVYQYIKMMFSVIENFFLDKTANMFLANHTVDEMKSIIETVKEEIVKKLDILNINITYKDSFMEMVDTIKPKSYNNIPFHYLNPSICFYGRESEISSLDTFINDDRQILFTVVTGAGGSGKSRLVFEYINRREFITNWSSVYFTSEHIDKAYKYSNYYYDKNLLIIIDYAGSMAKKIGRWLYMLCQSESSALAKKIRIVLIERQGIVIEKNNNKLMSSWINDLFGFGEQKICLKEIAYNFGNNKDEFFLNLNELSNEVFSKIISNYTNEKGTYLSKVQSDEIIIHAKKISSTIIVSPLIVLLVTDFYIVNTDRQNIDYKTIFDNVLRRYENYWKYTLCKDDTELYNSIELLLIYSTAKKCISITDILDSPYNEALKSLLSIDYDDIVTLISGINGKDTFDNYLYPLEPDLIGEYFFLEFFRKRQLNIDLCNKIILPLWDNLLNFADFLERCFEDFNFLENFKCLFKENFNFFLMDNAIDKFPQNVIFLYYKLIFIRNNENYYDAIISLAKIAFSNKKEKNSVVCFMTMFCNIQSRYRLKDYNNKIPETIYVLYEMAKTLKKYHIDDENIMMVYAIGLSAFAEKESLCNPQNSLSLLEEVNDIFKLYPQNVNIAENFLKAICIIGKVQTLDYLVKYLQNINDIISMHIYKSKEIYETIYISLGICGNMFKEIVYNKYIGNYDNPEIHPLIDDKGFIFYSKEELFLVNICKSDFNNIEFINKYLNGDKILIKYFLSFFEAVDKFDLSEAKIIINQLGEHIKKYKDNKYIVYGYATALFNLSNNQEITEALKSLILLGKLALEYSDVNDIILFLGLSLMNHAEMLKNKSL